MDIEKWMPLAKKVALKMAGATPHLKDDLISEAYLSLVKISNRSHVIPITPPFIPMVKSQLSCIRMFDVPTIPITDTYIRKSVSLDLLDVFRRAYPMRLKGPLGDMGRERLAEELVNMSPEIRAGVLQAAPYLSQYLHSDTCYSDLDSSPAAVDEIADLEALDPEELTAMKEIIEKGVDNLTDAEYELLDAVLSDAPGSRKGGGTGQMAKLARKVGVSRERIRQRKVALITKIKEKIK